MRPRFETVCSIAREEKGGVVAEKFQAMASLGERNTRMKDFYDVWYLAVNYPFEGSVLAEAITATFAQRLHRTESFQASGPPGGPCKAHDGPA